MGGHWHCFSVRFGRVPRGRIGRRLIWTAGFVPAARLSIPLLEFRGFLEFPEVYTGVQRLHRRPRIDRL